MQILPYHKPTTSRAAGQKAASQAIEKFFKKKGYLLKTSDIKIVKEALGNPSFEIRGMPTLDPKSFSLSISHTDSYAAAEIAEANRGGAIGIDIERVRKFTPIVYKNFLTLNERRMLDAMPANLRNKRATLIWSIKEAYLKALKAGLRIKPSKLEIRGWRGKSLYLCRDGQMSNVRLKYRFVGLDHVLAQAEINNI